MKNIDNVTKYYGDFSPMERLNLVIAADVGGDKAEIEKLFVTCPRYRYRQADLDFTDRYDHMVDIGLTFIINREECTGFAHLLYSTSFSLKKQIDIYNWVIELIGNDETKKEDVNKAQQEIKRLKFLVTEIDEKYWKQIIKIKSALEAYRQFCNEIGIREETALKWVGAHAFDTVPSLHFEYINIDEEVVQKIKSDFYKIWKEF